MTRDALAVIAVLAGLTGCAVDDDATTSVAHAALSSGAQTVKVQWAELTAKVAGCTESTPISQACQTASARYCYANGYATGFGPVEYGARPILVCLNAPIVAIQAPTWTDLATHDAGCTGPAKLFDLACRRATNRYCTANKFVSAAAITEFTATTAYVSCLRGGAKIEDATFQELRTASPQCTADAAAGGRCITAVSRYCGTRGYASGYGLHDVATNGLTVRFVCVAPTSAAIADPPIDVAAYIRPASSEVFRTAPAGFTGHDLDIFSAPTIGRPDDVAVRKFNLQDKLEVYRIEDDVIRLYADHSGGKRERFNKPWLKRWQRLGESFDQEPFEIMHEDAAGSCSFTMPMSFRYSTKITDRKIMDWPGLGRVDTLVMTYTYLDWTARNYNYETNWYVKGHGWVKWELRDGNNNILTNTNPQLFSAASTGPAFAPPHTCGLFPSATELPSSDVNPVLSTVSLVDTANDKLLTIVEHAGCTIELVRCNLQGLGCTTLPLDAGAGCRTRPAATIDEQHGRLLIVTGDATFHHRLALHSCALDGTGCNTLDLGAFGPDSTLSLDPRTDAVLVGVIGSVGANNEGTAGVYRCNHDGAACVYSSIDLGGTVRPMPYGGISVLADPTSDSLLITSTLGVHRCTSDGQACTALHATGGTSLQPAVALDPIHRTLLVAYNDLANNYKPTVLRCPLDDTSCSVSDVSAGQGTYSGHNPSIAIDSGRNALVVTTRNLAAGNLPFALRCKLDGTSCFATDISAGKGAGFARTVISPAGLLLVGVQPDYAPRAHVISLEL